MRSRVRRAATAAAISAASIAAVATTAEATTWYTYATAYDPGTCSTPRGVLASGKVTGNSRYSSNFFISQSHAYTASQPGMTKKYYDVRHYNDWRKVHDCVTPRHRYRWQRANPVTNCYIETYYLGAYVGSTWSSGSC